MNEQCDSFVTRPGVARRGKRGRPRKGAGDAPSPEQLRRLKFIERAARWTGRVGRRAVATTFDLSLSHVSLDLQRYRAMAPNNLIYDVAQKCFRPTERFRPVFDDGDAANLLSTIAATAWLPEHERGRLVGFAIPAEAVQPFPMAADQDLLAMLCRNITGGGALEIGYQSLNTPEPVNRTFSPRALIYTGQRWLVRGWDGRHDGFRDLALARIVAARDSSVLPDIPRDDLWHDRAILTLVPVDGLSPSQAKVTAREYGMIIDADGTYRVEIPARQALVPYLLDYLRLRPADIAAGPVRLLDYEGIARFDRQ